MYQNVSTCIILIRLIRLIHQYQKCVSNGIENVSMYQNDVLIQQRRGSLIRFDTLFDTVLVGFDIVCIKSSFDTGAR